MNKEQQIEEMAELLCDYCHNTDCIETRPCDSIFESVEILFNAGYRKTFTSELASAEQRAFKEGYQQAFDECTRIEKIKLKSYEGEIQRLKDENDVLRTDLINTECNLQHITSEMETIRQAKIEVLEKLKNKASCITEQEPTNNN